MCRKKWPVNGACKEIDTIYEAIITDNSNNKFKYIGKSSAQFIQRYRKHKKAIKNIKYKKNCELSIKTWELKEANIDYKIEWNIRKKARSYSPGSSYCNLCLEEIYEIIFYNEN